MEDGKIGRGGATEKVPVINLQWQVVSKAPL
jgi:hypothetical protein